jgi:hypothetical protein
MNALAKGTCLVVLSIAGLVLGALSNVTTGRALVDYEVYVNPGAATNSLTCGYHVTCDGSYPDANRMGLDWGNSSGNSVYWRSWGYKSVGSQGTIASGKVWDVTDSCKAVAVEVYSTTNAYKGAAGYMHTNLSGTDGRTFYISGSTSGSYTSYGAIGTTAGSEIPGCPWTAAHLHQFSDVSGWYANGNVYPDEPGTGVGWDLTSADNWQNRRPWSQ